MVTARESLLGPSYLLHRQLIERSRGWSQAEVVQYQQRRLQRLLSRYGNAVRDKDDYRQHLPRYTRWGAPVLTQNVRTGGTSGQPLRFRGDTFARRQKERAYLFDIWADAGYRPHDIRVVYRGDVHDDLVRFDWLENAWVISPNTTTEEQLTRLRHWLVTLPPFFLHVYPSSLYPFIELVGEDQFRRLSVRGVLAGSEAFPTAQRVQFERDFGIPVAHWYGHSEYAVLAYSCRACQGFHFYPTYGYVELLPSGVDGFRRIVASSFNRFGTQFVRYDTDDLAAEPGGSCDNNFPRVGSIVGRSQETFVDNRGRRRALGPFIFGMHGAFWDDVRDLQFVQDEPGRLRVRLVTNPRADRPKIELTLARRLPMAGLQFEYVSRIERSANGKRRYFVDVPQAAS